MEIKLLEEKGNQKSQTVSNRFYGKDWCIMKVDDYLQEQLENPEFKEEWENIHSGW